VLKNLGNVRLSLAEVCRDAAGADVAHLVTRETGRAVRAVLARELEALPAGAVLTLDFAGVGIIDFSCADECLAKLLTRLVAGEFGEKYVRLASLGESQRENLQVALERKRLAALLVRPGGGWDCVGTVTPHLLETLRLVMARDRVSARALAKLFDLELTTASTRLGSLHRLRLVRRHEQRIGEGGREYLYQGLAESEAGDGTTGD
jgi:hypothetical protein